MFQFFFVLLPPKHQEQSLVRVDSPTELSIRSPTEKKATTLWGRHGGKGTMWKQYYSLQKQNVMQQHIYYTKYALQFADMQISELVTVFNHQVGNTGWTGMRAYHDQALFDEFLHRGIDVSAICDGKSISFAHPVRYDIVANRLATIG
jgi:hypothetical protein